MDKARIVELKMVSPEAQLIHVSLSGRCFIPWFCVQSFWKEIDTGAEGRQVQGGFVMALWLESTLICCISQSCINMLATLFGSNDLLYTITFQV